MDRIDAVAVQELAQIVAVNYEDVRPPRGGLRFCGAHDRAKGARARIAEIDPQTEAIKRRRIGIHSNAMPFQIGFT